MSLSLPAETLKKHRKFENAVTMYHLLKIFMNFSQLTGRLVNYLFQRKTNGYLLTSVMKQTTDAGLLCLPSKN